MIGNNFNGKRRKIAEISNKINLVRETRVKIVKFIEEKARQYKNNEISYEEYSYELNKVLKGRTPQQWIKYYNDCIKYYKKQLQQCEEELEKERKREQISNLAKNPYIYVFLMLTLIFGFFLFKGVIEPQITGLVVGNVTLNKTTAYDIGEQIGGNVSIIVKSGDLIPNATNVNVTNYNQSVTMILEVFFRNTSVNIMGVCPLSSTAALADVDAVRTWEGVSAYGYSYNNSADPCDPGTTGKNEYTVNLSSIFPNGNLYAPDEGTFYVTLNATTSAGSVTNEQVAYGEWAYLSRGDTPAFAPVGNFAKDEEYAQFTIDLSANISDPETLDADLNFTWTNNNTNIVTIAINNATDIVTFTPVAANVSGSARINLTIWDKGQQQNSSTFVFTVTEVNDLPWLKASVANIARNEDSGNQTIISYANLKANFSDVEDNNNPSTITLINNNNTGLSTCGINNSATGDLLCMPLANQSGSARLELQMNDSGNLNMSFNFNLDISPVNDIPWFTTLPYINSTDGSNKSNQDLWCSLIPSDVEDSLTVDIGWLKNNITQISYTNEAVTKNALNAFMLESANLTVDDRWNCQVRIYDGTAYSNWVNSTQLLVLTPNTAPTTPVPRINSTEIGGNYTNATVTCLFDCSDADVEAAMFYNITWFKNNVTNLTFRSSTCTDDAGVAALLRAGNTTKIDNWSCQVELCDDEMSCSTKVNSSHIIIKNSPPKVNNVTNITFSWDSIPVAESQNSSILFSFVTIDLDKDITNARANITRANNGTMFQFNNSCATSNNINNDMTNYTCNISFQFWNYAGLWNLSVQVFDGQYYAVNNSVNGTRATLLAAKFYPSSINWTTAVELGQKNITANDDPIRINNTGNDDIGANSIRVKAIELRASGLNNETKIPAQNFSASTKTGAPTLECDYGDSATTIKLSNNTATGVPGSIVLAGPSEEDSIYFCLLEVPYQLLETPYNTTDGGQWVIDVV